jgi:hypothetical protein
VVQIFAFIVVREGKYPDFVMVGLCHQNFKEKLVKHFTQFMSTFEGPLPRNSISKYFTEFATPFFLPHLSVLIIIMSHFYCTTIILQVPLQNHFSNTSPKSLFI